MRMSFFFCTFAAQKFKSTQFMEATLQQPVLQQTGTISDEKWNSLRTIDELDSALQTVIHKHFQA